MPHTAALRVYQKQLKCIECDERVAYSHGRCRRCYQRAWRGSDPRRFMRYRGKLCLCGCGKPARGRSGLARLCYNRQWHRGWMRRRMFRVLGTTRTLEDIERGLLEVTTRTVLAQEAIEVFRGLLFEIRQGRLCFMRLKP